MGIVLKDDTRLVKSDEPPVIYKGEDGNNRLFFVHVKETKGNDRAICLTLDGERPKIFRREIWNRYCRDGTLVGQEIDPECMPEEVWPGTYGISVPPGEHVLAATYFHKKAEHIIKDGEVAVNCHIDIKYKNDSNEEIKQIRLWFDEGVKHKATNLFKKVIIAYIVFALIFSLTLLLCSLTQ